MRLFRSISILLILSILIFAGFLAKKANSSTKKILIQNIELQRSGKQISVSLLTNDSPVYEITENLSAKTLIVKFKKAQLDFSDERIERHFNDSQLAGIRFLEIDGDIWAQFKLLEKDLSYSVATLNQMHGIKIDFRPVFDIQALPDPLEDAAYILDEIKFNSSNSRHTSLTFFFSKKSIMSSKISVPEDGQPPRIFLLEDHQKNHLRIRLPNTMPKKKLEKIEYSGTRFDFEKLTSKVNQTFIDLKLKIPDFSVEKHFVSSPLKWRLDIVGIPVKKKEDFHEKSLEKLTTEELTAREEERKARRKRNFKINPIFSRGENALRKKKYDEAVNFFRQAYSLGKEHTKGEFGDPLNPLSAKALFRIGDTIYTMMDRRLGDNYHQAIDAYKTAIRITQDAEKIAKQNGNEFEAISLLPHANFRIGRAYQKMNFQHESEVYYNILQKNFPNSNQAIEANFWRGISKIDQRKWESGISNFQQYLRSSPKPKFYAVTHYKMAQAYYHLERYITSREFFDIARDSDKEYVKKDPTLLFHMGETYYENADFVTAREIFRILLQKYPNADFSKLVALRLGDFLRDEGKEEEAIEAYKNAISSYSREIALLGKLRIANIKSKRPYSDDYLDAIKVYSEITRLYPDTPQAEEAMLRHGLTLTLYGFYSQAIYTLESFLKKYPNNVYVLRNVIQENIDENLKGLIDHYFRKDDSFALVGAYNDYKAKYLLNFRFGTTLFQTAVAHRKLGFFDEALDIYNFLENTSSGTIGELVQFEKAKTLFENEDLQESRNTVAKFIKNYPQSEYDAEARQLLAMIYRKQKLFPRSLFVYKQTIDKYEQKKDPILLEIIPELYFDLGELHKDKGNYLEAGDAFEKTISSFRYPTDHLETPKYIIKSHFLAAEMHDKAQKFDNALSSYKKAISLYLENKNQEIMDDVFWARFRTGTIYKHQGKDQLALKIFKELMDEKVEEDKLWKKLANENFREISNRLAYGEYLKD